MVSVTPYVSMVNFMCPCGTEVETNEHFQCVLFFSFLIDIILNSNNIIYIWLLFSYNYLKLIQISFSNDWTDIDKIH